MDVQNICDGDYNKLRNCQVRTCIDHYSTGLFQGRFYIHQRCCMNLLPFLSSFILSSVITSFFYYFLCLGVYFVLFFQVFLTLAEVENIFYLFSIFLIGVLNQIYYFYFFSIVNSQKNIFNKLIFDSPSILFPLKLSKFFKTNLVFILASKLKYSIQSSKIQSSNSINLISIVIKQSWTKAFLFFQPTNYIKIISIFFTFSCFQYSFYQSYWVSTWISFSSLAYFILGGSYSYSYFCWGGFGLDFQVAFKFRPKEDKIQEYVQTVMNSLFSISLQFSQFLPLKNHFISYNSFLRCSLKLGKIDASTQYSSLKA